MSLDEYKLCPECIPQSATDRTDSIIVTCDNCGNYKLSRSFHVKHQDEKTKSILSIMTRRANEFNKQELCLHSSNYKNYIEIFESFSPQDRANFLIEYIGNNTDYGLQYPLIGSELFITASLHESQLLFVRDHLIAKGILELIDKRLRLTFKGWERFEDISTRINSNLCFFAIPFSESNINLYEQHLKPLLKKELGFDSVIVSERQHNEDIVDRIIYEINRCRFVIADASDKNSNVYYEAGYARGLGKTVIWICRKSEEGKIELPFDTRNINHIVWETENDLKSQLKMRILATISVPENLNASTR